MVKILQFRLFQWFKGPPPNTDWRKESIAARIYTAFFGALSVFSLYEGRLYLGMATETAVQHPGAMGTLAIEKSLAVGFIAIGVLSVWVTAVSLFVLITAFRQRSKPSVEPTHPAA